MRLVLSTGVGGVDLNLEFHPDWSVFRQRFRPDLGWNQGAREGELPLGTKNLMVPSTEEKQEIFRGGWGWIRWKPPTPLHDSPEDNCLCYRKRIQFILVFLSSLSRETSETSSAKRYV